MNRFFVVIIIIAISGCSGKHLINSREYRTIVEDSFSETELLAQNRTNELFSVFDKKLSCEQVEALKYLFAFMPLNDLADYPGDFFLANIDISLKAMKETPWGKTIPEDIFLHYVLPPRVNTENLDSFRLIYYDEIMKRVGEKELIDAALEINHWCHEKVTYQPSDSRTSAPVSTILSARGRCGEESVFTVAALRTAGIPARQVYTPRWAHSDDNHAWVEIWNDGTWYYLGACEPEPVLDRGWFTEPARRAMLIHTKAFGAYNGNEKIINRFDKYSEINNLSKYAVTKQIFVKTIDGSGSPVKNAMVEFQLYNYAEFYPLATVPTNEKGICTFETGFGDLLVWARKNEDFTFRKISVIESDTIILTLGKDFLIDTCLELDLSVPPARAPLEGPSAELTAENSKRLEKGNMIRQQYIDTWIKPQDARELAQNLGLDSVRTAAVIARSMGNYKNIISFLNTVPDTLRELSLSLLEVLADKDLRDTRVQILTDHLINSTGTGPEYEKEDSLFIMYILNPRVANEIIASWRGYFREVLPKDLKTVACSRPELIADYLNDNIRIADDENHYKVPLTPIGVNEIKVSDTKSRSICFVAIYRSLGIPARLEPGSNVPQYYLNKVWNYVYFADQKQPPSEEKAYLKFESTDQNPSPEYYTHFTVARFSNGRFNTLEYDFNKRIDAFKDELQMIPGHYMLVTGNRINDREILSEICFFELAGGEHKTLTIKLRKDISPAQILGKIDTGKVMNILSDEEKTSVKRGKGLVIVWIEPDKEPTKHVLNDLPLLKKELDAWGGLFVFLSVSSSDKVHGVSSEQKSLLPSNSIYSNDENLEILKGISDGTSLSAVSFPLILMTTENGDILFRSEGYRIGIGEQILKNNSP